MNLSTYTEPLNTYDDILVVPKFSNIKSRSTINLETKLTNNIRLKIPIISANMDTITEDKMAIAMAKLGGLGIIHRYCSIEEQVQMVKNVKRYTNYIIENPYTLNINDTIDKIKHSSYLVVNNDNKLVGIVSKRDILYNQYVLKSNYVKDFMNPSIIAIYQYELENGEEYIINTLLKNKIEKLPIIDSNLRVKGLITLKDIMYRTKNKHIALLDNKHRLMVGAAVGVKDDYLERTKELVVAGCDIICIDVAHGHHELCGNAVKEIKKLFPNLPIIAGNVCTPQGVEYLYKCGADVVKVGIGGGSICITRVQTGCGMPQFDAVVNCGIKAKELGITIIADGGHSGKSGNIFKALCGGSSASMLGGMLSGTDETPGDVIVKNNKKVKMIRGMAGRLANLKRKNRTGEEINIEQLVPEGVEGYVPYKGPVKDIIHQICGGIKSGMSYIGCNNMDELKETDIEYVKITQSGKTESGSHDINEI
jgi:IMP dehydrogenase